MKRIITVFFLLLVFNFSCWAETKNPYVPNKLNIWIDKEFLKYYQEDIIQDSSYKDYTTEIGDKEIIRELIKLLRLQLKTNLILIKQNKRLIELLEKNKK